VKARVAAKVIPLKAHLGYRFIYRDSLRETYAGIVLTNYKARLAILIS
jgi:hypothetical protein